MTAPVYFVQQLGGYNERLVAMATGRLQLTHPSVARIVAGLQPLDRIELHLCRFDDPASLSRDLRQRIADAEQADQGWRVFDAAGTLRCKKLPCDAEVVYPTGSDEDAAWRRLIGRLS